MEQTNVIFVLGMGRSGTSAMTRVLSLCGAALPRHLVGANEWNERGYWEPAKAIALNDAFLNEHASTFWDPRPLEDVALTSPRSQRFIERIVAFFRSEYPPDGPIVVKEPRIGALLPFWIAAVHRLGYRPSIVQMIRHPDEVWKSMRHRDAASRALSQLLWLKYNVLSMSGGTDIARVFVAYDDLLRDWEAAAARCIRSLKVDLSIREETRDDVDTFLAPSLRHHTSLAGIERDLTGGLLTEAFALLRQAANDRSDERRIASLVTSALALPSNYHALPTNAEFADMPETARMIGNADRIHLHGETMIPLDQTVVLGPEFCFDVHGWALRTDGHVAVDAVIATLDGRLTGKAVADHRPDIIAAFGTQAGLAGYKLRITGTASEGPHVIDIFAIGNGCRTRIGSVRTQVVQPHGLVATPLLHLFAARSGQSGAVAEINGWGLDPVTGRPLAGAALLVDDRVVVPCSYGESRPEVGAAFDAAEDHVGFRSLVEAVDVEPGPHRITAIGVSEGEDAHIWVSDQAITVEIAA